MKKLTIISKLGCMVLLPIILAFPMAAGEGFLKRLEQLYEEYTAIKVKPTVGQLVNFDTELREFIENLSRYRSDSDEHGGLVSDMRFWREKYAEMGLDIQKYSDAFCYSGIFLIRAHKLDPNSPWRKSTLYSTILGEVPAHGLGMMPDIKAAFQYEREFPGGPFIAETLEIIAGFFTDLYMICRDEDPATRRNEPVDYKLECYKSYISRKPLAEQREQARKIAVSYYRKYLKLRPNDAGQAVRLQQVIDGTIEGWSFCAD